MKSVLMLIVLLAGVTAAGAQTDPNKLSKQPHPNCLAWNDGCVRCDQPVRGIGHCTEINVPGTCKPHAIVCTRDDRSKRRS
jgi:hypothetical protein